MSERQPETTITLEMWDHFQTLAKEDHDYLTAEVERLRRVAEVLRCFPLPSQSASATENYRRMLEWLYRDSTDWLICDLAAEAAAGCTQRLAQVIGDQNAQP